MKLSSALGGTEQVQAGQQAEREFRDKYSALPAGQYKVWLTDWAVKVGERDGHSFEQVALTLEVIDGEHKNRKLFENVFIAHTKYPDMAVQGGGVISQFIQAAGSPPTDDLTPLKHKPVVADIAQRKRKYRDDSGQEVERTYNNVTAFAMSSDHAPAANPVASAPQQQQQPPAPSYTPPQPAGSEPPWMRNQ